MNAGVANPTNLLNETGVYDSATDWALWSAPCKGFDNVDIEVYELQEWYKNLF